MSNEFVMVPRELADRIAKICMFTMYKEDYRAISEILSKPAEQHQGEPVGTLLIEEYFDNREVGDVDVQLDPKVCGQLAEKYPGQSIPLYTHADPAESLNDLDDAKESCAEIERTGTPGEVIREMNDELVDLQAENARLIEDRARFPDRPDDIGTMIGCHIGNLKAQIKSAEDYSRKWRWELEAVSRKLDAANALLQEFCDRVDRGEVRSNKSYAKFKAHLSASAEPSAPKCGNCSSSTGQACNENGCGFLEAGNGEPLAWHVGGNGYDRICFEEPRDLPGSPCIQAINDKRQLISLIKRYNLRDEEPSAPVEIDERTEFETWFKSTGLAQAWGGNEATPDTYLKSRYGIGGEFYSGCCTQSRWEGWQARADLEREQ